MIKRCLLYKATRRGGEARSGKKRCREEWERGRGLEPEWEPETETGTGTRTGIRTEIRIAAANGKIRIADANGRSELLMQTGTGSGIGSKVVKWETGNVKRDTGNGKRETGQVKGERGKGKQKTRKRGNEEGSEAEGNTARDGDKAPNLTNE